MEFLQRKGYQMGSFCWSTEEASQTVLMQMKTDLDFIFEMKINSVGMCIMLFTFQLAMST